MKIIEGNISAKIIAEEGKYIHRIGDDAYFVSAYILPKDTIADFEEVDSVSEIPEKPTFDYDAEVNRLIRERYTESAEFALLRQRDSKPEEFAEYNRYCEECKIKAKEGI